MQGKAPILKHDSHFLKLCTGRNALKMSFFLCTEISKKAGKFLLTVFILVVSEDKLILKLHAS